MRDIKAIKTLREFITYSKSHIDYGLYSAHKKITDDAETALDDLCDELIKLYPSGNQEPHSPPAAPPSG